MFLPGWQKNAQFCRGKNRPIARAANELVMACIHFVTSRDAGAVGVSAPLAFCIFNFVGAVQVQTMGVTGAQTFYNRQN